MQGCCLLSQNQFTFEINDFGSAFFIFRFDNVSVISTRAYDKFEFPTSTSVQYGRKRSLIVLKFAKYVNEVV